MGTAIILVTDIDGTLVGDDRALARFATWHAEHRDEHRLVYATGRHLASLTRIITDAGLPAPDATITAVGTEIHDRAGRRWPGWPVRFERFDAAVVRNAMSEFHWLAPQAHDSQTSRKVSYDVRRLGRVRVGRLQAALSRVEQDARLVYSAGLHLDIVPARAGKGEAAAFLARSWGGSAGAVLVFGDTGNDADLFRPEFRGTVVGNASPELVKAVGDRAYRSQLPYAAGVLDGIRYWTAVAPLDRAGREGSDARG